MAVKRGEMYKTKKWGFIGIALGGRGLLLCLHNCFSSPTTSRDRIKYAKQTNVYTSVVYQSNHSAAESRLYFCSDCVRLLSIKNLASIWDCTCYTTSYWGSALWLINKSFLVVAKVTLLGNIYGAIFFPFVRGVVNGKGTKIKIMRSSQKSSIQSFCITWALAPKSEREWCQMAQGQHWFWQ